MKSTQFIILFLGFFPTLIQAQDGGSEVPGKVAAIPSAARILGDIPDGTPSPPSLKKPEFHATKTEILGNAIHAQDGRFISIRHIKPIDLPPPPPPTETTIGELDEEYRQRLAAYSEANPKNELLFLGATIFRFKDCPPRTLVRWWPQGGNETISFWSSADFSLIAGGINSFMDSAADTHHLLMSWSEADINSETDLKDILGDEAPEVPDFPDGKSTFQFTGDQPSAGEIVVIKSLHDIYSTQLTRLRTAYEGRERARIEREAYLKANPPQPKNVTLNYWRIVKPASGGKVEVAR